MPTFIFHDVFSELVVLLLVTAVTSIFAMRLRQPLVIGFIAVGILAGPSGLQWITSTDQIHVLAEMGLALLLFVVGLRLDLHIIRSMGVIALNAGVGQVIATTLLGFLLCWGLGMPIVAALYVALALTFSSTIIIVKLLSDKHETESLHGRLALGILIVQDLVVVLVMIVLTAVSGHATYPPLQQTLMMLARAVVLLGGMWLATFVMLPRLLPVLARSTELLVLFGIAWALALALLSDLFGFGKEVGAFLAGISLASTEYREIIGVKLVSLRDFLLLFFFIELGSRLKFGALGAQLLPALLLAIFVLLCKPLLVMGILSLMGYRKRTSFLTGLHMAQISEFSLILVAMGVTAGHIGGSAVGIVTLVGLISIGLSSYLLQYARPIYDHLLPYLSPFGRKKTHIEDRTYTLAPEAAQSDVILFGLGGYGSGIAEQLLVRGRKVLGVDFDPQAIAAWTAHGGHAVFGDVEDPDFAASLPLAHARWVVSTIQNQQINMAMMRAVRHAGYTGNLAYTARTRRDGQEILDASPGLLLVPFEDAAVEAVDLLLQREEQIARDTMDKLIETISAHYVVCGYGRMGQQIVKDFLHAAMPFVVVEDNPEQLPRLRDQNIPHVIGNASQDEVLGRAGIMRAKGLIAVASTDEANVFIVLTARGINADLFIVARSIREENEDKLRRAGADRVMSPYILGGHRMAAAVTKPGVMDFLDLVVHDDAVATEIGHLSIPMGAVCVHHPIGELGLWHTCGVTILAVKRTSGSLIANPNPECILEDGDDLIVMGTLEQIADAQQFISRVAMPTSGTE